MGFSRGGEEVRTQFKVQSHSSGDQVLTRVPHLGCEVYFLQEAPQLCGVDVMQPLGGRMRKIEHAENKNNQVQRVKKNETV